MPCCPEVYLWGLGHGGGQRMFKFKGLMMVHVVFQPGPSPTGDRLSLMKNEKPSLSKL